MEHPVLCTFLKKTCSPTLDENFQKIASKYIQNVANILKHFAGTSPQAQILKL